MISNTRNLFSLFQKIDYRDKEKSAKRKLAGILLSFVFANTVLSYNYFVSFDEKSFIILSYTSNLFLLALIILTDFENLILAFRTSDILESLPVKESEILKAKFYSAILYLFIFILASAVPQIIFYYIITYSFSNTAVFLITDIMFCYFSSGVLILIYVFALRFFKKRATLILNFLQISFFVFIFYSSTLSSKAASQPKELFVKMNILNSGIVNYLPQTFFANSTDSILYFTGIIIVTAFVLLSVYLLIAGNYSKIRENISEINYGSKKSRNKSSILEESFSFFEKLIDKYILSNNYETASFYLVKNMLQNSRFLVIKYMPLIVMPLLIVIIGMITDAPHLLFLKTDPLSKSLFNTGLLIISPSVTFTLVMCSRLLISGTKILDENSSDTEWIYDSLPVKEIRYVNKGVNKFIYLTVIFPVMIIITILLGMKAGFPDVIYNMLFISSGIYFINSVMLLFDRIYPFTLESTKFNSASKFFEVFYTMILGIILFLIQIFVFQNIIFVITSVILFLTFSILLNRN